LPPPPQRPYLCGFERRVLPVSREIKMEISDKTKEV
jgi:hypothetical protein